MELNQSSKNCRLSVKGRRNVFPSSEVGNAKKIVDARRLNVTLQRRGENRLGALQLANAERAKNVNKVGTGPNQKFQKSASLDERERKGERPPDHHTVSEERGRNVIKTCRATLSTYIKNHATYVFRGGGKWMEWGAKVLHWVRDTQNIPIWRTASGKFPRNTEATNRGDSKATIH